MAANSKNAFSLIGVVGRPAEVSIRMEKKGDLRDFEPRIIVGLRRAGLSTSKLFDLLEFS